MNLEKFGFKAQNVYGEWVYAKWQNSKEHVGWGIVWEVQEGEYPYMTIFINTLCRCSGLRDSNGTLIYEHDYIRVESCNGVVVLPKVKISSNGWVWNADIYGIDDIVVSPSVSGIDELYAKGEVKIFVIGNEFDKE